MRNIHIEGVIIKRKILGEADRLLTVFTKQQGKIQVKAVGVRRIPSRRASHVELLNLSLLTLYKGKGMPILIEAQTIENFSPIKEDLTKIGFAYHVCELIDGLCPENQENWFVFSLLQKTLSQLTTDCDVKLLLHNFEITLLKHLGFYPERQFAQTVNTHSFIEDILERKLKTKPLLPYFS